MLSDLRTPIVHMTIVNCTKPGCGRHYDKRPGTVSHLRNAVGQHWYPLNHQHPGR